MIVAWYSLPLYTTVTPSPTERALAPSSDRLKETTGALSWLEMTYTGLVMATISLSSAFLVVITPEIGA